MYYICDTVFSIKTNIHSLKYKQIYAHTHVSRSDDLYGSQLLGCLSTNFFLFDKMSMEKSLSIIGEIIKKTDTES